MDLDDEELKATRKLNGANKESNVEEDIKRCKKLAESQNANWIGISNQLAIAHLIEKIKEVEEENKKYTVKLTDEEYRRVIENAQKDIKKQCEQKVKDKIKELENMLKKSMEGKLQEYTVEEIIIKINMLNELLEEGK